MYKMRILNLDNWCEEAIKNVKNTNTSSKNWNHDGTPFVDNKRVELVNAEGNIVDANFDGIITGLHPIDKKLIDMFPPLKFIASGTTGLDHIDLDYCKAKGIDVISLKGETEFLQDVHATAEHTFGLILSLVRRIPFAHNDVCNGNWNREAWQGVELYGKTLGIVGLGRVGKQVAKFAEAFGMKVIWHDPYIKQAPPNTIPDYYKVDRTLECLFRESDIVTVHVPLNPETTGMFGYQQFALMKSSALFINTSRGAVVNESNLLNALEYGIIAGVALDVSANEPGISPSMQVYLKYTEKNIIVTPHISGNTVESRAKTQCFIANKIKEYIEKCDVQKGDDINVRENNRTNR